MVNLNIDSKTFSDIFHVIIKRGMRKKENGHQESEKRISHSIVPDPNVWCPTIVRMEVECVMEGKKLV